MASPFKKALFSDLSPMQGYKEREEEELEVPTELDINGIASWFNQTIAKVHFCHHNTTSFATHKAIDELYDGLTGLKDDILEQSIGYTGARYNKIALSPISGFTEQMCRDVTAEVMSFASILQEWAEEHEYPNIENLAQELSGVGAKVKYLLTLK